MPQVPVVYVVCNVLLGHLAWRYFDATYISRKPFQGYHVDEASAQQAGLAIAKTLNKIACLHKYLFAGSEVMLTVKLAVSLFVLGRLGEYWSAWGILNACFIALFTLPVGYCKNRTLIDATGEYEPA